MSGAMIGNSGCVDKKPESQQEKASYSIGWDIGKNMKRQSLDVNHGSIAHGLKDALSGGKSALTDEEMQEALTAFQRDMQAKQMAGHEKSAGKNKKEGEDFLAKNKSKQGVMSTASGLQYKVISAGTGAKPSASDTVTVHYEGKLLDGTVFDSSYKRKEPATFPLNGVIPGWTEALQLMPTGSKYELYLPSQLAYGERGAGGDIGPNAVLIFTVELISIQK